MVFYFSTTDWSAQHKIQYSYKLVGLEDRWSEPSQESKADYRNIPHGNYVFKVRAVSANGKWSEVDEFEFLVHPPWWLTWWAWLGYAIIAFLVMAVVVRIYMAQHKQRQKELENQGENNRDETSAQAKGGEIESEDDMSW